MSTTRRGREPQPAAPEEAEPGAPELEGPSKERLSPSAEPSFTGKLGRIGTKKVIRSATGSLIDLEPVRRVLLVQADPINLMVIEERLIDEGYEVEACRSIQKAVEMLDRRAPSLVLVDATLVIYQVPFFRRVFAKKLDDECVPLMITGSSRIGIGNLKQWYEGELLAAGDLDGLVAAVVRRIGS